MLDNIDKHWTKHLHKAIDKAITGIAACKYEDMIFLFEYCQLHIAQRIQFNLEETE